MGTDRIKKLKIKLPSKNKTLIGSLWKNILNHSMFIKYLKINQYYLYETGAETEINFFLL